METQKNRDKFKLTSVIGGVEKGIILAILTFAGYITAYNYEKGYLSYFGVPSFLIRLGLEEIIVATSVVATGLFSLYIFVAVLYPFRNLLDKSTRGRTLLISIILFLFLFPFIFVFSSSSLLDKLIVSLVVFLLILFLEFGFPLLLYKGKNLEEKIVNFENTHREVGQIENFIFSRPKLNTLYVLFLFVFTISGLANSAGIRDAAKQKDYLLFSDKGTYAVIRTYVDKRIAVEVNDELKHIESKVRVMYAGDNLELRLESIGPLKKEEERSVSVSLFSFIKKAVNEVALFFKSTFSNVKRAIFRK